ncbi:MAG TPA: RDD family protein [Candidatus Limnocylindrales bacterium]|nr:RDD family protein [Candidatus Limnocylindrales bacterium]
MADNVIYCSQCGAPSTGGAGFCQKCGARLAAAPATAPPPAAYPGGQAPAMAYQAAPTFAAKGYGGFWIRFVAIVIDTIVVRIAAWPLIALFGLAGMGHMIAMNDGVEAGDMPAVAGIIAASLAIVPLLICLHWLYEALLTSSQLQATLGKKALGLKVTDEAGNRISFARASGRYFAKFLSAIFLIGYIMAAFTDRKRALHDMIAGTLVIKA